MTKQNYPKSTIQVGNTTVSLSWIRSDDLTLFVPYYQVYGIVFNDLGEILVIKEKDSWKIPGGTPERNETMMETLSRELMEESDVVVEQSWPLGAQMVEYPNNPKTDEGDLFYQLRFVCKLKETLPQTPDPDTGVIYPRQFVPADQITKYVKWGEAGDAMFADAINMISEKL